MSVRGYPSERDQSQMRQKQFLTSPWLKYKKTNPHGSSTDQKTDEEIAIQANALPPLPGDIFAHPYVVKLEGKITQLEGKYDGQVKETHRVLEESNVRLSEMQEKLTIAQSAGLAKYMLDLAEVKEKYKDAEEVDADNPRLD